MANTARGANLPLRFGAVSEIGDQIREARRARGMSMVELAEAAGVDLSTVGRIERGKSPNASKAGMLQRVLDIGPYAPAAPAPRGDDPPLSQATFAELQAELAARYGQALRAGGELSTADRRPLHPEDAADTMYLPDDDDGPSADQRKGNPA